MLVQSIAPYVTKVCFDGKVTANYQQLFFESLSKNQRNVTIKNLRKVDEILIETVKKLNEKNIFVTLKNPEDDILFKLSGLRFDCLKLSITKDEFSFFIWNNFPCTFSKNLKKVDEFVIKAVKKLNKRNIPVTLENAENELLLDFPGLYFDCLKISTTKEAFSIFLWNAFSFTFSKLNVQFVDSKYLKNLGKVFGHLNTAYSNVQSIIFLNLKVHGMNENNGLKMLLNKKSLRIFIIRQNPNKNVKKPLLHLVE
uniref:DUF38 domain-containing protein n=1 Tax=Panagrolaimus sp. JU765 TaxID=591449 RepID=A0AC34R7C0_9BILA